MKLRGLLVIVLMFLVAQNASAGWFGYSDEEINACNQVYFGDKVPVMEDFLNIDLSTINTAKDAKILAKQLDPLLEQRGTALGMAKEELKYELAPKADHLLETLYKKEVHDEVWEQTFPIRQAAYKKALEAYNAAFKEIRSEETTCLQAKSVLEALKKIGKRFKEIKADEE
jgi:regulator of replication initiation timing